MNLSRPLLFLALFLTACPKRVQFGPEGVLSDPGILLQKVQAEENRLFSIEGDAKLRVESPEARGAAQLFVAASRPGKLHLEVLDFFGKPMAILVSDGEQFGFYDAKENRYFRGPATAANLARVLPVALPPRELVSLLLGAPPRLATDDARLAYVGGQQAYELKLMRAPFEQTLWVDPVRFRVGRSHLRGPQEYEVVLEELQKHGEAFLPAYITLSASKSEARLELRYTQVKVNVAPDLTLFEVQPPEGIPVIEVDEGGRAKGEAGTLPGLPLEGQ